jgi:hypothetical protein
MQILQLRGELVDGNIGSRILVFAKFMIDQYGCITERPTLINLVETILRGGQSDGKKTDTYKQE